MTKINIPMTIATAIVLLSQASFAEKTLSLPFFRHPQSPFPSGEASARDLEKNWIKDEAQMSYEITVGNKKIWAKANDIARDINLSMWVEKDNTRYKILKIDGRQVFAQNPKTLQAEWFAIELLTTATDDLGIGMNLIAATLHEKPEWKSLGVRALDPLTRLQIKKIYDNWIQVSPVNQPEISGWIDNSNILLKHDFASAVMTDDNKWINVAHRNGTMMIGSKNEKIPLQSVRAMKTKNDVGVSLISDSNLPLLMRQTVSIAKTDYDLWSASKLPGHGIIYWRKNDFNKAVQKEEDQSKNQTLKNEDLLKREVVSISFSSKKANLGIASAEGIYVTTDGKNWKKLAQFGNLNAPVLVDDDDTLYVGSERSTDLGEHFSSYLRWDELAHMVERKQQGPARELKIRNITSPRPGILSIEFDTGTGRLKMSARKISQDQNLKWDFE